MITIERVRMGFNMENETFACGLYGRWDEFCRVAVEKVIDDTLSRYDSEDEVIRLESLTLDLGVLPESDFYSLFPRRLAEKLDEAFADCLRNRGRYPVEVIPVRKDRIEVLLFFLLNGVLPPDTPQEYRGLSALLRSVLESNASEFVRLLREKGRALVIRERLAYQFADEELEGLVKAAEPSEALFITVYVRYLIVSHRSLHHPEITAQDYRNAVWQVVLAYLLYDGRSFFSRKQMVWQTVRGLAARFNMDFVYLLHLLSSGLEKFSEEWILIPELLIIFSEIGRETMKDAPEINAVAGLLAGSAEITPDHLEMLCRMLSRPDTCRQLLKPLKEEDIIRLVDWIIPSESVFIVSYARNLDREKERGMLEGKAGSEFRLLKWEFLFLVLLDVPVSAFHRKRFVMSVIRLIAAHYNLDTVVLLAFLCADKDGLPEELSTLLSELYYFEMEGWRGRLPEGNALPEYGDPERKRLLYILSHPVSVRQFLSGMPEEQIYRLAKIVLPGECVFVIAYAKELDREKERGMLEGKAGVEFRLLKWEFIFLVILSAPVSAFSRKQFVCSVLRQIAAHYNLTVYRLLGYFYRLASGGEYSLPVEFRDVLTELWEEERITAYVRQQETEEAAFYDVFRILAVRQDISPALWEEAGGGFAVRLLVFSGRREVAAFIRLHKEMIWNMVFRSERNVGELCEKAMQMPGIWAFLIAEYGEERLNTVLAGKGVPYWHFAACSLSGWLEMKKNGNIAGMMWWLKSTPEAVRKMWKNCGPADEKSVLESIRGNAEMQKEWIVQNGSVTLRQVMENIFELEKLFSFFPAQKEWLAWLAECTGRYYNNRSYQEVVTFFWQRLTAFLSVSEQREIKERMKGIAIQETELKILIVAIQKNYSGEKSPAEREKMHNEIALEETGKKRFYVANAGMVLLSPYFSGLFNRLGLIAEKKFIDDEAQVRAMFILQRLLRDEYKFEEPDLILNKLLVGYDLEKAVPAEVELNEQEEEIVGSLLRGAMQNWDKMCNTSLQGFKESFLIREGILEETGDFWQLAVEERGYDVLLDSLPWAFSPVKFPWMEKPVYVNWRN